MAPGHRLVMKQLSTREDEAWPLFGGGDSGASAISRHIQGLPRGAFCSQKVLLGKDQYSCRTLTTGLTAMCLPCSSRYALFGLSTFIAVLISICQRLPLLHAPSGIGFAAARGLHVQAYGNEKGRRRSHSA